jgi:hypothetical protein
MPRALQPIVLSLALAAALRAAPGPRFYADDPLSREPESRDASAAKPADVGLLYDLSFNLFVTSMRPASNIHARNVNTIDEVPDSGWFTNRMLPARPPLDELVRGPNTGRPPNPERWTITREKSGGFAPGFTAKDANGETWFVSFDPPGNPEGATGAMVIATKIFWALGYNQVETFITTVDPARLVIDASATMKRPNRTRTPMTRQDLNAILERAARNSDGTYRAAAGRLLPGKVLGSFRYEGTRTDDPNDVVEHEHRRELRALRVFGAWTNLTDLKAGNTLDTLVPVNGRPLVRHYLQDVGSTFGMGANGPHDWDEGFEYFYEGDNTLRRLGSFGFALSPWQTAKYANYPSVGRFESEAFDPLAWKPHTPTTAYMEMLPDDAFWAARRVAAFDDALIDDLAHSGGFSDGSAERHFASILKQRRDKIAHAYLPAVNPIVEPRLSAGGELTFVNAAVAAGVSPEPPGYRAVWAVFDNATEATRSLGETVAPGRALAAPPDLPSAAGTIIRADVSAFGAAPPSWVEPIHVYFRRTTDGWKLIGLDRGIGGDKPATPPGDQPHK